MRIEESSFGVIPLKKADHGWDVLLILHKGGRHWAFPKGRSDPGETPLESAIRELKEETGLEIEELLQKEPFTEQYKFRHKGNLIVKTVQYFPAFVHGEVRLQPEEIQDAKWVPLKEAGKHLTFREAKEMCLAVINRFQL
jgi:8-oxo-dGTP pyrophosphatase MutT (NUDIX family)